MKKKLFVSLLLAGLFAVSLSTGEARAFSFSDFHIQKSSFLPNNPFYFFKDVGRSLQRAITRDPIARAELELNILDERASEIMNAGNPDEKAMLSAVFGYIESVSRLKERFIELKDISSNPNIDRLIEKSIMRSVKHVEFFEGLKSEYPGLKGDLLSASVSIIDASESIPGSFGDQALFKERVLRAIEDIDDSDDREIRAISALNVFSDNISSEEAKLSLSEIKIDLNLRFEGRCKADKQVTEKLANIIGKITDDHSKIRIVDGLISVAEYRPLELKLSSLRNSLISYEGREVSEHDVLVFSDDAKMALDNLSLRVDSSSSLSGIYAARSYISLAEADLASASIHLSEGSYAKAMGSILSSFGRISEGNDSIIRNFSSSASKESLSKEYDRLSSLASDKKILRGNYPSIWSKMDSLKAGIVFIGSRSSEREIKRLLFEIEMLILKSNDSPESVVIPEFSAPEKDDSVVCPMIYDPVCGSDGKTYSNSCVAELSAGVKVKDKGECPSIGTVSPVTPITDSGSRFCILIYDPVCGDNGITYPNSCFAGIAGVNIARKGSCGTISETPADNPSVITPEKE